MHDRRLAAHPHAGDDGFDDGIDHAGYAPRPRHYEPRPETSIRGGVHDRVGQAVRVPLDDGIGRIKISIPSFSGKCEPEGYLEWEMRVDQIFDAHHYSKEKKVQLAGIEFTGYALIWWNQICRSRHRPTTWRGMKEFMRQRFVPEHYRRDMYNKLQRLSQGNMSVDEYYKEMELLMIRTGTTEDPEATMARFFNGLNIEVQDRVEMVVYYNIQDLVHQAVRAEQQIKRRQVNIVPTTTLNTWRRSQYKSEDVGPSSRATSSNHSHGSVQKDASKSGLSMVDSSAQSTRRTSDIECFKCGGRGHMKRECPNEKRVLLTRDGYASASDEEAVSDTSSEKSKDVEDVVASFEAAESYPSLMVQRVQEDRIENKGQRWNIFQTQCKVNNTNCKLIIDGGSYTNAVSKGLVDALRLPTWKHPQPHHVEWMYHTGKLKVTHKVRAKFSVGDYTDMVICDVIPMDACHLLLGRPWQYDHNATHEGRTNTYSFWDSGKRHVLRPMFENAIKVDGHVTLKKKVAKTASKPMTVSFEGGGDDVTIDRAIPCTLQIGGFYIEVPSTQPEKQEIKPTFRTPCHFFCIGRV